MLKDSLYTESQLKENEIIEESSYGIEILWKKIENGAQILRVYSQDIVLKLPAVIAGNPVIELASYCFSPMQKHRLESEEGQLIRIKPEEQCISETSMPEVTGNYLEGIILPDTLESLGNGAFYNCRKLRFLSLGKQLKKIGSDVFRNCLRLSQITVRESSDRETVLPLILERIQTELEVHFLPTDPVQECHIFFPECYEWFDDMITAHVFNRVIVGEGFRMRQCFHDHKLHFAKYDQCFANSVRLEEDSDICRIAINRLRWPIELREDFRPIYQQAIQERFDSMIKIIISTRDIDSLEFLCQHFHPDDITLNAWMDSCIRADWAEGNLTLITHKQNGIPFADKSYDFDEWE